MNKLWQKWLRFNSLLLCVYFIWSSSSLSHKYIKPKTIHTEYFNLYIHIYKYQIVFKYSAMFIEVEVCWRVKKVLQGIQSNNRLIGIWVVEIWVGRTREFMDEMKKGDIQALGTITKGKPFPNQRYLCYHCNKNFSTPTQIFLSRGQIQDYKENGLL